MSATLPLATLSLLCGAACDAQVGDEYRGEPLLSMQGTVVLSDPKDERNVVPAIAFYGEGGTVLIEPELQGQFPAQFRLDVTEPPPPEALTEVPNSNGSKFALGRIVVVPHQHGRRLPERVPALTTKDYRHDSTNDETQYTRELEKCTAAGVCLKRTLACKVEPCRLLESTPPVQEPVTNGGTSMIACVIDSCMTLNMSCDAAGSCDRQVHRCDISDLGPFSTANSRGEIDRCEVLSQTGDPSIDYLERLEEVAIGYYVFYFSKPTEFGHLGTLAPGYHLAKSHQASEEDRLAHIICMGDSGVRAFEQYNQEHGTNFVPYDSTLNDQESDAIWKIANEFEQSCPNAATWEVISEPLAQALTLVIGREPSAR